MKMDITFIDFINKTLPNLQGIYLSPDPNDFKDISGDEILFENVISAYFNLYEHPPPVAFQQLKKLMIKNEKSQMVIDFIKKQHHIVALTLECNYNHQQLIDLVQTLQNLETLYLVIGNKKWPACGLVQFLNACESINVVEMNVKVNKKPWRRHISNIWQVEKEDEDGSFSITKNN